MNINTNIRVLPDALANRIAAGEVVERPASVVKELLENSLDAGATSITVEIENAGKKLISISDNGQGMLKDDALLAIERHATSKIKDEQDLFSIKTLGFRGEALPSIASVSLFKLTTCSDTQLPATRLIIEGSDLKEVEETAFPKGTKIEVRELFYNTPARRKFLKADSTELSAITEIIHRIALSKPELRVKYTHNGRELLNLSPANDLHERVAGVFGNKVYPKLFPVEGERGDLAIKGMVSAPDTTRANPSQLHIFLNGRAIKDRMLIHAVSSAYGTMLEPKKFPLAALMLDIPYDLVDVNVHPAKTEVRFSDSRIIYSLIQDAVREALARSPWLGGGSGQSAPGKLPEKPGYFMSQHGSKHGTSMPQYGHEDATQSPLKMNGGFVNMDVSQASRYQQSLINQGNSETYNGKQLGAGFSEFIVLAQLHNSYILVQTPLGLGVIDQHAAHERVTFERLKKAHQSKKLAKQMLLFPIRLDLEANQLAAFENHKDEMSDLGFEVEEFGGDSVQIRAVPELLAGSNAANIVKDMLDEYSDVNSSSSVIERTDMVLATIACHASVRANDVMNYEEMRQLLVQMDEVDFSAACPHGRPVFIEFTKYELEKRFGRV